MIQIPKNGATGMWRSTDASNRERMGYPGAQDRSPRYSLSSFRCGFRRVLPPEIPNMGVPQEIKLSFP